MKQNKFEVGSFKMGHDKKLTGIIIFSWIVIIILIMGISDTNRPYTSHQTQQQRQPIRKEVKNKTQFDDGTENQITVHVIVDNESFCGSSTMGKCSSDADCVESGCSGQVCQSESEESIATTCEWKECYNNEKYGLSCQCVEGKCQWK